MSPRDYQVGSGSDVHVKPTATDQVRTEPLPINEVETSGPRRRPPQPLLSPSIHQPSPERDFRRPPVRRNGFTRPSRCSSS